MFKIENLHAFKRAWPSPPAMPDVALSEGKGPEAWFDSINSPNLKFPKGALPTTINRSCLLNMRAKNVPIAQICMSIFAWGGMRTSNGRHLLRLSTTPWLNVADDILKGNLSRAEGYNAFFKLRADKKIVGLGPAYFTKLLYFLPPPEKKGYIMDQWLGLSINLLTDGLVVKLDESVTWRWNAKGRIPKFDSIVSDFNSGKDYEKFCRVIEALSNEMGNGWTPEITELALVSVGGHASVRHGWRDYVVKERTSRLLPGLAKIKAK